ncbi:MAG: DUF7487 domain-containing protein [bacterium]
MRKDCVDILKKKIYSERYIKNNFPEVYSEIITYSVINISWLNKLYDYIHEIKLPPKCAYCNNILKFKGKMSVGYGVYCSPRCVSHATREKVKQTNLKNFGCEYPLQNKDILNKCKETNLKNFGCESSLQSEEIKNKINKTIIKKYGVDNISKSDLIKEKKRKKYVEKYGVDNPFKSEEIKIKIKKNNKNKTEIDKQRKINKTKETNLKKYGVETTLQLEVNREKAKEINLKNFGCEYPLQNKDILDKCRETILNKYAVNNISQSIEYRNIINNKLIKKWSNMLNIDVDDMLYNDNIFTIYNHCKTHGKFKIKYDDLYNRIHLGCETVCTKCNPINKQSKIKENEINDYLLTISINFNRNNRKLLNGGELDFYLPEHKLAIEFNGLYWHSNKFCNSNYHLNKTELCEQQGIQLLHVFEDEWVYKKEIVKSIINSKLNLFNKKIFARKTEVREITNNKLLRNFLENNHLQGFVGSKVKLGLFYENELVSVMTFGRKRVAMGSKTSEDGEFEMLRFCNKLNTQIIGGASKLLKYFIKNHNPTSITTYADRRYSNGELYKKLGFEHISNTQPNYFYFKKNKLERYHRFNFRKDVLVKKGYDINKTEHEIMTERGYLRIYDGGNMKFIMENIINQ